MSGTRNYIIRELGRLPESDAAAQRLLRNQDDIGNAFKPYEPVGLWNRRLQSPGGDKRGIDSAGPFFAGFLPHGTIMRRRIRQITASAGSIFAINDQSRTGS